MEDGRIPKDILYGELASGKRPLGRPHLRFKDACKRDMKALDIDPEHWESIAADRDRWRCLLHDQLREGENKMHNAAIDKRKRRKAAPTTPSASNHICPNCSRDCHSRIGLVSHRRRCRE